MKVALVYNWVEKLSDGGYLPDNWHDILVRFVDSYQSDTAGIEHDLFICTSGAPLSHASRGHLRNLRFKTFSYQGHGWDIGAYQHSAKLLQSYDFIVCLNSQAHVARNDWLTLFVNAVEQHGYGVYGASSSFEVAPHIRTSCIAFPPRLILEYPLRVNCRYDACIFEHSPRNFSLWAHKRGNPVRVVMQSGAYPLYESRKLPNIFRNGTQSELLIHDRHTLIYERAAPSEQEQLQSLADGRIPNEFVFLGPIRHFCTRSALLRRIHGSISRIKHSV